MTSKLGCHWMREHPDGYDFPHVEKMQYRSVKLFKPFWDNRDACADLLSVLPKDSYILARDHSLSEQKEDMWRDAVAAGIDHANQWINKVHSGEYHLPTDRTFFLGINEPDATNGDRNKIDLYTESFLHRLAENGLRGGAFNFSTGHPRTVDGTPNTPADYSVFERSHRAIVAGHHIAVLHIYGTGAVPCAPGHYDRLKACTWQDVQWVVGEMGVDEHVIGGGEHFGYQKYFEGRLNDYCGWLDTLIMGINDSRIHSYQVFTYDFAHPWSEFDIHPSRPALESFQWQHMIHAPTFPSSTPTPPVTTTMYVAVPSGARIRSAPVIRTDNILTAVPYRDPVIVTNYTADHSWADVGYKVNPTESIRGWMSSALLSSVKPPVIPTTPPVPTPIPPAGDKWTRTINWVLQWEGGYQNSVADKGNWTGCAQGKGENKGTNFGISACSYPHLDIKNLTKQQAIDIYARDYWVPSGASELPWPYCLLVMDTAVLHGVGAAKGWLATAGPDPYTFAAKRLQTYTVLSNWDLFGKGWVNRTADLLEEMST